VRPGAFRFYTGLNVRPGRTIVLDYDFPRLGRVTGTVATPEGKPLAGAGIRMWEFERQLAGETNAEGRFALVLGPGDFRRAVGHVRLYVVHVDRAPLLTRPIDLSRDQDLAFTLPRGGTLKGRVLGADGRVHLRVLTPGATNDPDTDTERDGSFEFDDRVRAGRHRVRIEAFEEKPFVREVEIVDGKETVVTFRVP